MKKAIIFLLMALLLLPAVAACEKTPDPVSSAPSYYSTASQYWQEESVDTSVDRIDPSSVTVEEVAYNAGAKSFSVTPELRKKYYDILSESFSQTIPRSDFTNASELSSNELVYFALYLTEPFRDTETAYTSITIYEIPDVQYTLEKYLCQQLTNAPLLQDGSSYIYSPVTDTITVTAHAPTSIYFYRLTELSVTDDGIYTAKLDAYREFYTSDEAYEQRRTELRDAVCADEAPSDLTLLRTITITFREMKDTADGSIFFRYLSRASVTY